MLRFHLDETTDLASRRADAIEAFVDWLDHRFPLDGASVTDLGCGPGLYTLRYAKRGATVTGVDFSANSLTYARKAAETAKLSIDYRQADYLRDDLPEDRDVITMIYGDFCAMAPNNRRLILDKVRNSLKPNGVFVFDVFSTDMYAELREDKTFEANLMNGFWAAEDYIGFRATFLYPDDVIGLDRYLIATPDRTFHVYNWMQYYTPAAITDELRAAGYSTVEIADFATGGPWQGGATAFAVIAHP